MANLRAAVQAAAKAMPVLGITGISGAGKPNTSLYSGTLLTNFQNAFQKAVRVLGNVDNSSGVSDSPDTLATNLNNI